MSARAIVLLLAASVTSLAAQDTSPARVPIDPYTGGDAAALQRAGYVSFGPFGFGAGHGSRDVDALLDESIVWIETAHFRIGCSLSPLELRGDRDWVARTRQELGQLKRRLPKVKADARDLDPWLRTHLIALRCEALYADVCTQLGVAPSQFPRVPGDDPAEPATFLGVGPHLGGADKFAVLVVRKTSSLGRYARRFLGGRETTEPIRRQLEGAPMVVALAEDCTDGLLRSDFALHTQLVHNLTILLYDAYRGTSHSLPVWLSLGLAHAHARRICPRFTAYECAPGGERETTDFWKWDERAAGLLQQRAFEPLPTLFARRDAAAFGVEQHIQTWAFVDWLLRARLAALRTFVHESKAPFHALRKSPSTAEVDARIAECWTRAFGTDAAAIEASWRTQTLRGKK